MDDAVRLDEVDRVGAKRHLRDSQDSCCAKNRGVSGTVFEVFKFTSELTNQEASADAGQLADSMSVKDALATALSAPQEAKEQLASLRKKHDTLEDSLLAGFKKKSSVLEEKEKGST